jgi:hypothetical protein
VGNNIIKLAYKKDRYGWLTNLVLMLYLSNKIMEAFMKIRSVYTVLVIIVLTFMTSIVYAEGIKRAEESGTDRYAKEVTGVSLEDASKSSQYSNEEISIQSAIEKSAVEASVVTKEPISNPAAHMIAQLGDATIDTDIHGNIMISGELSLASDQALVINNDGITIISGGQQQFVGLGGGSVVFGNGSAVTQHGSDRNIVLPVSNPDQYRTHDYSGQRASMSIMSNGTPISGNLVGGSVIGNQNVGATMVVEYGTVEQLPEGVIKPKHDDAKVLGDRARVEKNRAGLKEALGNKSIIDEDQ